MPAETVHETPTFGQPNRDRGTYKVELPQEVTDNLKNRSDKYNSQGVDHENPYNAFAPQQPELSLEVSETTESNSSETVDTHDKVLNEVTKELDEQRKINDSLRQELDEVKRRLEALEPQSSSADEAEANPTKQPRRVSLKDGVMGQLVKDVDGKFTWQPIEGAQESASDTDTAQATSDSEVEVSGDSQEAAPADTDAAQTSQETQPDDGGDAKTPGKALELYKPPQDEEKVESDEDKEETEEAEDEFRVEISQEMQDALKSAQDAYAEATAKHRNGFLGHVLHNSKFLTKIPFVQKLADKFNAAQDKVLLGPARDEYKKALVAIQEEIRSQVIAEVGATEEAYEAIRMNAMDVAIQSEVDLEMKIVASRMERSGDTNKFINWWVRQDGLGGKFKKAGLIAGAGLTAGLVVGLAGAPIIVGTVLGAGAGAGIGLYATKKRASAAAAKGASHSLAQEQAQDDIIRKSTYVKQQQENGSFASVADLVSMTEDRTGQEKVGNRRRVKAAASIGGLGGTMGAAAGSAVRNTIESAINHAPDARPDNAPQQPAQPEAPQQPAQPELQGTSFDVQPGSGYTQELVDFAQANGHNLSPDQSWDLHQALMDRFGSDYININGGGSDIYTAGADVRLAQPGSASWVDGVPQFIQQWMSQKGLW